MAITETSPRLELGAGLEELRKPVNRAAHAPGWVYASPEMYGLEKERMFLEDWLLVAREEELETPGDYLTLRLLGEPIVLTRDATGTLNAFANVCAHRGVEVASGAGNAEKFSCPYHGWKYDLTGKLVGAAYMEGAQAFDPASCRLAPLRLGTWRRNIYVTFNPEAQPLELFLAQFEEDFAFLHPERCRLSSRLVWDLPCNWKLVAENLMDMYHVGTLHAKTFGEGTSIDEAKIHLHARGGMRIDYASRPMTHGAKALFGKLPWLEDKPLNFAVMGFMQPNMHMVARSDQVRQLTAWPTGPDTTRLVMFSLFPEEHFERPDFAEKAAQYHAFLTEVTEEDRDMVASLQHAMTTRSYSPGRLAWPEGPIHHVVNGILDRVIAA